MADPAGAHTHDELLELAAIEALAALDPADRAALAAHLRAGCCACRGAIEAGRRTLATRTAPAPGSVLAMTLEPAGGVPAPTGEVVLASGS